MPQTQPPGTRVRTAFGRVKGVCADGVLSWKGIPYAAPPVRDLRWRPPVPPPAWDGVRDGTGYGAICVQPPSNGDPGVGPLPMSEDCLTLNIWAPVGGHDLPVMFWIHGGGYNDGSGTAALYDGAALARHDVVVVTINYRLGRLGFFDHPALAADRPEHAPAGNYGVLDQIAALTWVRGQIAAFGGNPDCVTVFGNSAGGLGVTQLMVAPTARGLFHRAIVQSGMGRQRSVLLDADRLGRPSAQSLGRAWAREAGLPDDVDAAALRALPADVLLTPTPAFYGENLIVDDQVVPEEVATAFAAGRQADVPLLIGANSGELTGIAPAAGGAYARVVEDFEDADRQALLNAYGGRDGYDRHLLGDLTFVEPARHLARLHARAGRPAWLYRFDVADADPSRLAAGAPHASERAYVFGNLDSLGRPVRPGDRRASEQLMTCWTSFARTGDPNADGVPVWRSFRMGDERLLNVSHQGARATIIPDADRLDLISTLYARLP